MAEKQWVMRAEEKLRGYGLKKQALQTLPMALEELELQGEHQTLRQELERQKAATELYVRQVDTALEALNPEERTVLRRFYLEEVSCPSEVLCEELCLERAAVYRRRKRALQHFVLALYGWEEGRTL